MKSVNLVFAAKVEVCSSAAQGVELVLLECPCGMKANQDPQGADDRRTWNSRDQKREDGDNKKRTHSKLVCA